MICFTIALVFLKQNHAEFWQKFFYLAFIVDYISVLSVCSFSWNIYVNVIYVRNILKFSWNCKELLCFV
jgi:hypothetical protein